MRRSLFASLPFTGFLALAALALSCAFLGCAREGGLPQLIQVLDFAPHEAEVGDRLEVIGSGFPEGKVARVGFRGNLNRPGERPVRGAEIEVEGTVSSAEHIEIPFTEGLQALFCGVGDKATHTTFHGDIEVAFPAASPGAPPVIGTMHNLSLDLRPPTPRRAVLEARSVEGERALAYLGIQTSETSPTAGGLLVRDVVAGSRADLARVLPGDVLTQFDSVRVLSMADCAPSGAEPFVVLGVRRAESASEEQVQVTIDGFKPALPSDLLGAALVLIVAATILLLFMAPTAGVLAWVERRVSARMRSRVGPNRAGRQGFLVWVSDGIKSMLKEHVIPTAADKPLLRLAPYLVFGGVSTAFVVMAFGQYRIAADLDIGVLYVVAVTSLVAIGLMTGGWASSNKYSMLGGIRSAAQIISYELPGAIAIACIVMMTGSLRMQDIIRAQGGWPWDWFMFRNPVTFALFFLYFTTALPEGNHAPFDLPEADSELMPSDESLARYRERTALGKSAGADLGVPRRTPWDLRNGLLVGGRSTERSGMRYLFFFFAEWANVFVMCGIATALFLGGGQLPATLPAQQEAHFGLQVLGSMLFLSKAWLLVFVVVWLRWTLPRVRVDQMMNLCWKWLVPLSLGGLLLTAGWVVWNPGETVVTAMSLAIFLAFCVLMAHFVSRVLYNLKAANAEIHLNPSL